LRNLVDDSKNFLTPENLAKILWEKEYIYIYIYIYRRKAEANTCIKVGTITKLHSVKFLNRDFIVSEVAG
jgi:hypothetical protein